MHARSRREGFTLIELMVVIAIIGFSVMAFSPAITRALAEREVSFTTREILRLAKRARSEALGFRRAYLLWVEPGASDTTAPVVRLIRANTSSCIAQAWDAMPGSAVLEEIDFNANNNFATRGYTVRMQELDASDSPSSVNRAICWSPDGVVYTAQTGTLSTGVLTAASADNTLNGAILYTFTLFQDGTAVSPPHSLLIPLGGAPMVVP